MKLVTDVTSTSNTFYPTGEVLGNGGLLVRKGKARECNICYGTINKGEQYIKYDKENTSLEELENNGNPDHHRAFCLGCVEYTI